MTFKANLLPQTNLGFELGSSSLKWKINGVDDPKLTDTTYTFTAGTSTLAWNTEVTLATVGGLAIKAKLPANPDNDIKVTNTLGTTTKYYITGTSTATTNTGTQYFDTGVYATTTAGELSAVRHSYNISGTEKAYSLFNSTTNAIDFVFI